MKESLKKVQVFLCVTATGKSYLAKKDDRFVDLDKEEELYKYGIDKNISDREFAKIQGMHKKLKHSDSEEFIKHKMIEYLNRGKIILTATHSHIYEFLKEKKIPYVLIQYKPNIICDYKKRMKDRGNSENFINKMLRLREKNYYLRRDDPDLICSLDLKKGQYLSDLMWKIFGFPSNTTKEITNERSV